MSVSVNDFKCRTNFTVQNMSGGFEDAGVQSSELKKGEIRFLDVPCDVAIQFFRSLPTGTRTDTLRKDILTYKDVKVTKSVTDHYIHNLHVAVTDDKNRIHNWRYCCATDPKGEPKFIATPQYAAAMTELHQNLANKGLMLDTQHS